MSGVEDGAGQLLKLLTGCESGTTYAITTRMSD
jgi:hypothetical protein